MTLRSRVCPARESTGHGQTPAKPLPAQIVQNLFGGVREMVGAANHVGDFMSSHRPPHSGDMSGPVGPQQHKIFQLGIRKTHCQIRRLQNRLADLPALQTGQRKLAPRLARLVQRDIRGTAVIFRLAPRRCCLLPRRSNSAFVQKQ